ncbi:MAG TPA: NAD(P)-dependent oxidoreductase [Terriglobales bacterium]|nr:NAD(P)-dependent oxidoreductase [Terriglobales bacterium]
MRICVTGGTGFLGRFLVRALLAKGEGVRVLARPSRRADELARAGAELVRGDLSNPESISQAVRGEETVYHLAARVGAPGRRKDYFEANVAGTERVLTACAREGVGQLVYLSSLAVYGPVEAGERIDEGTPLDAKPEMRDPYAESKIVADRLVSSLAARAGLKTLILRPGIIFGPGRPLPIGIFGFRLGRTDVVFGDPTYRFPLNYVENLVEAMQVAAASSSGLRQFNVLDDDDLTLGRYHEVKQAVEHSTSRFCASWPLYVASPFTEALRHVLPMGDTRLSRHQLRRALQNRWYDTSRIRRETGWQPKIGLEEALRRTVDAASGLAGLVSQ